MTKLLSHALELSQRGFHVFPIVPNSKLPAIPDYPNVATQNELQIRRWWEANPQYNVGLSTSKFGDGQLIVAIDVDTKKKGFDSVLQLELSGLEFPPTFTQVTPTGGAHFIYRVDNYLRQGADVFGKDFPGIDSRSRGGYLVGAGSLIDGKPYERQAREIVPAPKWLVERLGKAREKAADAGAPLPANVDADRAASRSIYYLKQEAPFALQGAGGDQATYVVACRLKDLGCTFSQAFDLMAVHWNPRCQPPWILTELYAKIQNAYRYGLEQPGAAAPELQFPDDMEPAGAQTPSPQAEFGELPAAPGPLQELNKEFAFVLAGGGSHILWETKDPQGVYKLEHLAITAFHQHLAAKMMTIGDGKTKPTSELWMKSPDRRSYDGICFMPGRQAPPRFYNLWRGFACEPIGAGETPTFEAKASLDAFLEHAKLNVCRGDAALFRWLMGYFAHIVQRPWEKPLVALVFRGKKGTGKNALIDRVGHLLGSHYLLTSNRRYLTSNFNGHLENCLLFTLDEAFWSGDKQAEGTLKDLITGKTHQIEHKGKEPYSVANCTRVVILGNEEWLVPATQDERRFAVFGVSDARIQDRQFFQAMRDGMERGGNRLLLRYLMDFDLSGVDVNAAPSTEALMDQKVNSLDPFHQWWLECLTDGRIVLSDFGGEWKVEVHKERFRSAFHRYVKERQIRSRIPEDRILGKLLKQCLPSVDASAKRREHGEYVNIYKLPELEQARLEWEKFIGHPVNWV